MNMRSTIKSWFVFGVVFTYGFMLPIEVEEDYELRDLLNRDVEGRKNFLEVQSTQNTEEKFVYDVGEIKTQTSDERCLFRITRLQNAQQKFGCQLEEVRRIFPELKKIKDAGVDFPRLKECERTQKEHDNRLLALQKEITSHHTSMSFYKKICCGAGLVVGFCVLGTIGKQYGFFKGFSQRVLGLVGCFSVFSTVAAGIRAWKFKNLKSELEKTKRGTEDKKNVCDQEIDYLKHPSQKREQLAQDLKNSTDIYTGIIREISAKTCAYCSEHAYLTYLNPCWLLEDEKNDDLSGHINKIQSAYENISYIRDRKNLSEKMGDLKKVNDYEDN